MDRDGLISLDELKAAIRPDTILISVMFANNEIGTIEPIAEIGEIAKEHGVLFHTDAVQAYAQVPINVDEMHIDMLSASGHKLNGPKGIGFLYIRKGVKIRSFVHGGAQERSRRAGTENIPGIVGLGAAVERAMRIMDSKTRKEIELRDYLIGRLENEIPHCWLNGHRTQDLKTELMNNGVNIPYHFTVSTQDGREQYRCPDYSDEGEEYSYSQTLFRNDPLNKSGIVRIHFPDMDNYIFSSVKFMIPSIAFTIVLLITFIFTIVVIFRQKRYTEIKNDFINNMTHELKTPISSISLAAQMLSDDTVTKSPVMMKHLGGVINDESKRLRFLVEKVLQMSMFDRKKAIFKKKELDLNDLAENVANTFTLRVEHTGGHIQTQLNAKEPTIYVDEMHFTNVIFNLLDNAVKYKHPDRPVELMIKSWNEGGRLYLSVKDNGIGLKKENLKKIFEKFYRVHTGNVHDVKGFGLGLAYVKKIVELHKGEIHVESERGKGTKFIISLPEIKSGKQTGADE